MITFSNIPDTVQQTLFDRMDMLDRNSNSQFAINTPITAEEGKPKQNYMFTRSVFMRMISLQPPASNPRPIILSGGEADHKGNLVGNLWGSKERYLFTSGLNPQTKAHDSTLDIFGTKVNNHGKYWAEGDSQPFRPMPGVKDISVEYKGGGRTLAATRGAEINWTCWTYEDLDRLTAHFLHTGNTVFIDWGWSGVGDIDPTNVELFPILIEKPDGELDFSEPYVTRRNKRVPLLSTLPDHIINQKGNYDAMIGIVQDFEWSVRDDGGFDCVTTLISTGVNILQQSLKTSSDPRLTTLPTIIKGTEKVEVDHDNKGIAITVGGAALTYAGVMWWNPSGWWALGGGLLAIGGGMAYDAMFAKDVHYITPTLLKEFQGEGTAVLPQSDKAVALEVEQKHWLWGSQENTHYVGSFKGSELLKKISPYITFDIYVKDLYEQLRNTLSLDEGVIKSGHIIRIRTKVDPGFVGDKNDKFKEEPGDDGYMLDETYVTWGWFEDNVLSRFFSRLIDNGQGVMGEFRSYEEEYDESGNFSENVPVKIRNHKSMLTTDLTKFLLLKENDPIHDWVLLNWSKGWKQDNGKMWKNKNFGGELFMATPLSDTTGTVKLHMFDDEGKPDSGILRNVYFNVRHLAEKMSDGTDIESAVRSVWSDFASEYGGIYDFYLDYSDDQNRIIVKDRGWTFNSVKSALDNRSYSANPDAAGNETPESKTDGLFEFPTWKKNSIVKSQNLSARLPDRMKLVAMYGASNLPDDPDDPDSKDSFNSSHHEDQAGLAWGQLTSPIDPELELERGNLTTEEFEQKVLDAAMLGKIDYPWRDNRSFGSKTANIDKELYIQQLSEIKGGGNLGQGTGTIMYDSVIQKIMDDQYAEYIQNLRKITATTTGTTTLDSKGGSAKELEAIMLKRKEKWIELMLTRSKGELSLQQLFGMYQLKKTGDRPGGSLGADGYGESHAFKLGSAFKQFMMKEIRGFTGHPAGSNPIVPIEFELDVDGVAGIFPGNAFQSSYLPEKYKKISCFQVMGVNQKVDSSGWTSTVKGQIRISVSPGKLPEPEKPKKKKKKKKLTLSDLGYTRVTDDQVIVTKEYQEVKESFQQQLAEEPDIIARNFGKVRIAGGSGAVAEAGDAAVGPGNITVAVIPIGTLHPTSAKILVIPYINPKLEGKRYPPDHPTKAGQKINAVREVVKQVMFD